MSHNSDSVCFIQREHFTSPPFYPSCTGMLDSSWSLLHDAALQTLQYSSVCQDWRPPACTILILTHWETKIAGNLGDEDAAKCVFSQLCNMIGELRAGQQVITGGLRAFKLLSQNIWKGERIGFSPKLSPLTVWVVAPVAERNCMKSGQGCEGLHTVVVV